MFEISSGIIYVNNCQLFRSTLDATEITLQVSFSQTTIIFQHSKLSKFPPQKYTKHRTKATMEHFSSYRSPNRPYLDCQMNLDFAKRNLFRYNRTIESRTESHMKHGMEAIIDNFQRF